MNDIIFSRICEPLLNAYKSKDYIRGIALCRDNLIDALPFLNKSVSTGNGQYIENLIRFEKKMQKKDFHGACGNLYDALSDYYTACCYQVADFNEHGTKFGTVCAGIFLESICHALEEISDDTNVKEASKQCTAEQ